ncbi:MAG: hypothetical protein KF901_01805 [Myxococcales bacterium]|nr:hypothetical protein [Myxococcales bacterium]
MRGTFQLAWLALVAGCYLFLDDDAARFDAEHGDAGTEHCATFLADPVVRCPSRAAYGAPVTIEVGTTYRGCCAGGELIARARHTSLGVHDVFVEGRVCECCTGCPCIGPLLTTTLTVEDLPRGRNVFRAGSTSCVVDVVEEAECVAVAAAELRIPRVLFPHSPFGFTLRSELSACGCTPRLSANALGYGAALCGCGECEDEATRYEMAYFGPPLSNALAIDGAVHPVSQRQPESCALVSARFEIVPPDWSARRFGPPIWWVHAVGVGEQPACCTPQAGVDLNPTAGHEWHVGLRDCTPPCGCEGPRSRLDAWAPLGPLGPGGYALRDEVMALAFHVP